MRKGTFIWALFCPHSKRNHFRPFQKVFAFIHVSLVYIQRRTIEISKAQNFVQKLRFNVPSICSCWIFIKIYRRNMRKLIETFWNRHFRSFNLIIIQFTSTFPGHSSVPSVRRHSNEKNNWHCTLSFTLEKSGIFVKNVEKV